MTISTQNSQSVNGSVSLVREGLIAWIVLNRPVQLKRVTGCKAPVGLKV